MPYKRRRSKTPSRSYSRARKRLVKATIPRNIGQGIAATTQAGIIGSSKKTKLSVAFNINSGSSTAPYYTVWSGNGMYDPGQTTGTTQPSGFDELMAIYQKYVVYGSSCKITGRSASTAGMIVGVYPTTASSHLTTLSGVLLQPNCVYQNVGAEDSGSDIFSLSNYATTGAMYGKSKATIKAEDNFNGGNAANPTDEWYWNFQVYSEIEANAVNVNYQVVITYYCEFFNPKLLTAS